MTFLKTRKSSFLQIGFILKAHGIKGEVFVKAFNENSNWPEIKILFIERDSGLFSFMIESYRPHKLGWIFKLKEVNDRNQSEELVGCSAFLPKNEFTSKEGDAFYLSEIKGFSVHTKENEDLGLIIGFSLNAGQDLIWVEKQKKQITIPFVQDYIVDIQFEKKVLTLNLPPHFLKEFT